MVRAGDLPDWAIRPTAIDAYYSSTIISFDVASAPSGGFHYWDIGTDGHVAMATDHGWAMMASCRVSESWGDCIGNTDVVSYTAMTGAKYLGWSYDYAGAELTDVRKNVGPGAGKAPTTTAAAPVVAPETKENAAIGSM